MPPEDLRRADRERRIKKDGCGRDLMALHQVYEVHQEFLRPLDRKSGNEQCATVGESITHLSGEPLTPYRRVGCGPIDIAISRFDDDVIEVGRCVGIRLKKLVVRANVAGDKNA
jgi:hypothetical protein